MSELEKELYDIVRGMAARVISLEGNATLEPTELMHEAWMKVSASGVGTENPKIFVAVTAKAMRHVLVDHARKRAAEKRGGGMQRTTLSGVAGMGEDPVNILALEQMLEALEAQSPRTARLVELRIYGGLSVAECAEVLEVSESTLRADWRFARALLKQHLTM